MNLSDLRPAPYNPRTISDQNAKALSYSLAEFGDISGITWNRRTGHLVSGHQRLSQLRARYGDALDIRDDIITTPEGGEFKVRVVDWDVAKEKAANLAANSPDLQGDFTEGVKALVDEVTRALPDMSSELRLANLGEALVVAEASAPLTPPSLTELQVMPLPSMTWVLVGIPTPRFIEISNEVEHISALQGVFCEVTANNAGVSGES